jgi:hypothetical protein
MRRGEWSREDGDGGERLNLLVVNSYMGLDAIDEMRVLHKSSGEFLGKE